MKNWVKYMLSAIMVAVTGFAYIRSPHRNVPSDFRDQVADEGFNDLQKVKASNIKSKSTVHIPATVANSQSAAASPVQPVKWIAIDGGTFLMGSNNPKGYEYLENEMPAHMVTVRSIDMSKTAVTVEQYAECVNKGMCTVPTFNENARLNKYCNWGKPDRRFHPVNCVNWHQANQYAAFISNQPGFEGARLPTEAEWEYAATSGGRTWEYPWGFEEATCNNAVMTDRNSGERGCGNDATMPVCSKPAGNSKQGLCDMEGNIAQWVQDTWEDSYKNAPTNGSAVESRSTYSSMRAMRGAYWASLGLRSRHRDYNNADSAYPECGFRLARFKR